MRLPGLVVLRRAAGDAARERGRVQGSVRAGDLLGHADQRAPVPVRERHHPLAGLGRQGQRAERLLCPGQERAQRVGVQAVQHEDLRTAQDRGVQLEARVLGRGAHEGDRAVLHVRQETVLLRLVEAVDLVDEEERAAAVRAAQAGGLERAPEVRHAGEDRADRHEGEVGQAREQARDRRLAGAGRTPEDQAGERAAREHGAERAVPQQVILADDVLEPAGPQRSASGRGAPSGGASSGSALSKRSGIGGQRCCARRTLARRGAREGRRLVIHRSRPRPAEDQCIFAVRSMETHWLSTPSRCITGPAAVASMSRRFVQRGQIAGIRHRTRLAPISRAARVMP